MLAYNIRLYFYNIIPEAVTIQFQFFLNYHDECRIINETFRITDTTLRNDIQGEKHNEYTRTSTLQQ